MSRTTEGDTVSSDEAPLKRPEVEALSEVLGQRLEVLDQGFVRLIDYMGSDAAIVQAARVSYGSGTRTIRSDRALIRYLFRHRHTSPFEMCEIKFHVRVPMDCWRQWIRHRTANVNEYSTRYSVAIDAALTTDSSSWRLQSTINKQGSSGTLDPLKGEDLTDQEHDLQKHARDVYSERLALGIAREQARKDLPLSTYTEAYWKIDLSNLLNFLALRLADNAQLEIRQYANVIGEQIVSKWCPLTWEAFLDYRLNSLILSETDKCIIHALTRGDMEGARGIALTRGLIDPEKGPTQEAIELDAKLALLGIAPLSASIASLPDGATKGSS